MNATRPLFSLKNFLFEMPGVQLNYILMERMIRSTYLLVKVTLLQMAVKFERKKTIIMWAAEMESWRTHFEVLGLEAYKSSKMLFYFVNKENR